ncbi:Adenylate kinase [uncultured archaeon]|nr:Adenylate kinase [uncultured archaeon]
MRLVLLGPPGSGKGTQAEFISRKLNIPWISVGELLREEVANKSELGQSIAAYVAQGTLAPDEIVEKVVLKRLSGEDCANGFLLDGFPRDISQAKFLMDAYPLDLVIYLRVPDDVLVKRLSERMICEKCGEPYSTHKPPKKEGICDDCGGRLIRRKDDMPDVVRKRISLYHESTEPLVNFFREKGILDEIDGNKEVVEITEAVLSSLSQVSV